MPEDKTTKTASKKDHTRMSIGDHLDELRSRFIKAIIGFTVAFIVTLFFGDDILQFVTKPLLSVMGDSGVLYTTNLAEPFITYLKVCMISAIFLSCPWLFMQVWGFIGSGLYPVEKKFVNIFIPISATLFVTGAYFFITIAAPISFDFFIDFSQSMEAPDRTDTTAITQVLLDAIHKDKSPINPLEQDHLAVIVLMDTVRPLIDLIPNSERERLEVSEAIIRFDQFSTEYMEMQSVNQSNLVNPIYTIGAYVQLVMLLSLAFSIAFQMPLVVLCLGSVGLVKIETFQKNRKYMVLIIMLSSAMMTPPDPMSLVLLSVPMYMLFEIGIVMLKIRNLKKHKKEPIARD